ncbi:16S rRNA (guanine(527)-N(7))-methyltransferase RsmG [Nesterenkonia natronophila]|uniref:Ribosomal RNA small subunit methyltransferase G n=1 Tax=Nesterenkonia natronophila TaxID=2174932 RepID=A0A3A4G2K9_9MICC|nr:16S rRNA (guanine(527)-N(7))-methyltransferase RsmG [Nesterenkonia natronophila]RJN32409.1 16S rRNA (guanine(527)-N(7))-methyltransferase RsmG [Nesterenkonia natronophila]
MSESVTGRPDNPDALQPIPALRGREREAAQTLFGERLPGAEKYVEHLCTTGITHGLLGPREVPRMWGRHVLNCAVVGNELPASGTVADVGSGAGLPGIAMALARPDVEFTLIEPMERRVDWLDTVIRDLGLDNVQVIRARAEDVADEVMADVVTARAVSALKKLIPMTVPLLDDHGQLIFLKGRTVQAEVDAAQKVLKRFRLRHPQIELVGQELLEEPTTIVRIRHR